MKYAIYQILEVIVPCIHVLNEKALETLSPLAVHSMNQGQRESVVPHCLNSFAPASDTTMPHTPRRLQTLPPTLFAFKIHGPTSAER